MGSGPAAAEAGDWGAERAHLAKLQNGAAPPGFRELRKLHPIQQVHRNVGIPGWYADSGIHWNAGPGSGPDDFCGLGGSLRCRPLAGARPENRGPSSKPAGRAGLGFLPSTALEFVTRRAEQDGKTQRGRGFWG